MHHQLGEEQKKVVVIKMTKQKALPGRRHSTSYMISYNCLLSVLLICCFNYSALIFSANGAPPMDYFVYTTTTNLTNTNPSNQNDNSTLLPKIESIYSLINENYNKSPRQALSENEINTNTNTNTNTNQQQQQQLKYNATEQRNRHLDELSKRVLNLIRNSSHQHDNNLVDLEATQAAWHLMERQALLYMRNQIHAIRPTLEELIKESEVSQDCSKALKHWLDELAELRHWASLMWNSWGSLPAAGLFSGSFTDLGSYRGCMSISDDSTTTPHENNDTAGPSYVVGVDPLIGQPQYCTLDFQPLIPTRPRFHSIFKQILGHQDQQLTNGDFGNFPNSTNSQMTAHRIASRRFTELSSASIKQQQQLVDNLTSSPESSSAIRYSKRTIVHNKDNPNQTQATAVGQSGGESSASAKLTLNAEALIDLARKAQYFYYVKFRLGACMPSKCSPKDVELLAKTAGQRAILQLSQVNCMQKQPFSLNNYQLVAIWILSSLAAIALLGTLVDLLGYKEDKQSTGSLVNWLLPFSTWTNARRLFDYGGGGGTHSDLECIHGLRFFSMIWVIYGHTILYMEYQAFTHFYDVVETQIPSFLLLPTLNANFSVDTFFVISGILTTYVTWEYTKGDARKFNKFAFTISRYVRLTPQLAIVILCFFLLPLFGDGPMYRQVTERQAELCYKNWAINLLYLQSYINSERLCIDPSWWLSIEMSFHVISMVVIITMIHSVRLGMWVNFFIASTLMSWGAIIHYTNGFAIQYLPSIPQRYEVINEQTNMFFHRPYPHAASYFIGIALGYILATRQVKKLSRTQLGQGWLVCALGLVISLWGSYYWNLGAPYTQLQATLYYNLCQILWPVSIAWIILACSLGHGGMVNSILSAKCFVPLGRITYMTYLSHALIIYYHSGTMDIPVEPSMLYFTYLFLANTCLSLALGVVLTIVYESPLLNLQKQLFSYLSRRFDPTLRDAHRLSTTAHQSDPNNQPQQQQHLLNTSSNKHHDRQAESTAITQTKNGTSANGVNCCLILDSNSNKQQIGGGGDGVNSDSLELATSIN